MQGKSRARSSSLFLLELIIAILFFSIASAVCVQLFVKAHSLNNDAKELDFAVGQCSAMAEIVSSADSSDEIYDKINELYPQGLYFDENFSPCKKAEAVYSVSLDMAMDGSLLTADITTCPIDSKPIYSLEIKHNLQKEAQ